MPKQLIPSSVLVKFIQDNCPDSYIRSKDDIFVVMKNTDSDFRGEAHEEITFRSLGDEGIDTLDAALKDNFVHPDDDILFWQGYEYDKSNGVINLIDVDEENHPDVVIAVTNASWRLCCGEHPLDTPETLAAQMKIYVEELNDYFVGNCWGYEVKLMGKCPYCENEHPIKEETVFGYYGSDFVKSDAHGLAVHWCQEHEIEDFIVTDAPFYWLFNQPILCPATISEEEFGNML